MSASFQIMPLSLRLFSPLFAMDDIQLARLGARRVIADQSPGFPCRVSLEDAAVGETVILLPFTHHDVASPYRTSGPIFVRQSAVEATLSPGEIPAVAATRLLSVRAYDATSMMIGCDVTEGSELTALIEHLLTDRAVSYLHLHNARPGCYSCRVERL